MSLIQIIQKQYTRRNILVVSLSLLAAVMITGVYVSIVHAKAPKNTDPRRGDVIIGNGFVKFCDGATLIYRSDGLSRRIIDVIPHSDECIM